MGRAAPQDRPPSRPFRELLRDELDDYLGALESERRRLRLSIRSPELLRKPRARNRRSAFAGQLDEIRDGLRDQMRQRGRRPFRGPVSVELNIHAMEQPDPPTAPKSVKAYLDALNGIAYDDDRQVAHLVVNRAARDHPRYRNLSAEDVGESGPGSGEGVTAVLSLWPLRVYAQDFQRAFRLRDEFERWVEEDRGDRIDEAAALKYFHSGWEHGADDEDLDRLLDERRDDEAGSGAYGLVDAELAATMRGFREDRILELRTKLLLDQRPMSRDRPGPDQQERDDALARELGLSVDPFPTYELPGAFDLPVPVLGSAGRAWERAVADRMVDHRARWRALPDVIEEPLALDMAVRGDSGEMDIDNLAHRVLAAFENHYCGSQRGTVAAYRAYRAAGDETSVRVLVMTERRLRQLDELITGVRHYLLRRGPHERDRW
jgi:hypothetical protein